MATTKRRAGGEKDESAYVKYLCYRASGFVLGEDKELVWIPTEDDKMYARAEVIKKDASKFTVKLIDNPSVTKEYANNEKNYMGVNPPKFDGVEDMAELGHLNEPAVLWNMTKRYDVDLFHTYSGLFLVIVNPYKRLPIYTDEIIEVYTGRRRDQVAPHVFALADTAYRAMLQDRQNQSMLITGESGAGKTENTKKVIQYLAYIAGRAADGGTLEQQLLEFNPILEAFGNAKTTKNNNSSRFGKFIELQFNAGGQIAGANTLIYLLEKSRVVFQAQNERNFHVFYQLIAGCTPEEKTKLHLTRCEDFNFLNQSGCTTVKYTDDAKEFEHTQRAFDILNVTAEQQWGVWEVIAAILHLGNLPFTDDAKEHATLKNETSLNLAAELLGVDAVQLREGLLRPKMIVGGGKNEVVVKAMNFTKVVASRDALVKALYGRLFNWIVHRINDVLSHPEKKALFIGVLDISGFEIFPHNSFEQLCINYTNEKLQQFFNHHMFTLEQKEYEAEKIEWSFIDFGMDSQDTIDLIEKPPNSILTILDEQTNFPDATDSTFCRRLHRQNGAHRSFRKPRFEADTFKIVHYAGEVEYETEGWLEKNRDPLEDDLEKCMKSSKHELVLELFREGAVPVLTSATAKASLSAGADDKKAPGKLNAALTGKAQTSKIWITVGWQYKEQLAHLMETLRSTNPHFIRCILPNMQQRPGIINAKVVLDQLKCNGVLEGIRITRKGFPNRIVYPQFLKRYHLLKPGAPNVAPNPQAAVKDLVEHLLKNNPAEVKTDQIRYGLTKIFFRTGQLPAIERLREKLIASMVVSIQAGVRAYLARRLFDKLREQTVAAKVLQRNLKAWMELRDWLWWKLFIKARVLVEDVDWQKEIDDLKAKVADLEGQIRTLTTERDGLLKTQKTSEDTIARLTRELSESQGELQTLRDAKDDLEADKKLQSTKIKGLQEELDDESKLTKELEGEKKRLEDKVLAVQNQVDDAENKIKDLENQKQKIIGEKEELHDRLDDSEAAAADLKKRCDELERKLLDVEDQKFDAVGTSDVLRTKLRGLEENNSKLQGDLAEEQRKSSGLESTRKKLEADVERVTRQFEESTKEKEALTLQTRKLQADLTSTRSELESEKTRANKLDKQQGGMKARLREIEDIAESAKDTEANVQRAKKAMEEKLEEQAETIKDLEAERRAMETRLSAARADAEEANRLYEEAENAAKRWEQEAKQRFTDIADMEAELESERENVRKSRSQLNAKISELTVQLEIGGGGRGSAIEWKEMQDELNRVRKELSETRDKASHAEKGLSSISTERDDYKMQFEKVESQLAKLRQENRKLQNDLDQTRDTGGTAQAARELLQKTNQEYLTEINTLKRELAGAIATGGRTGFDQAAIQKENSKLKEEFQSLDRRYRMAEIDLREMRPQLDDLRFQLEQEKINNSKINASLKDKEKMLMERELANARLLQSLTDSHSSEKTNYMTEVQELKQKNEELNLRCVRLNDDMEILLTKLSKGQK